jgi:Tfp pilus assembly protein FimT
MVHHGIKPRSGFTFVELMLGIVVTAIVLCALAVFTFGVGENWEQSDSAQSAFLAGSAGVNRLDTLTRNAQGIDPSPTNGSLDNSTSPASCMFWTDNYLSDGHIQYCEMTLLQYDQANQRLVKYTLPQNASNAGTQSSSLMPAASFKALPNVVETAVVHDVAACQIFTVNAGSISPRPSVEFILQMKTASGSSGTLIYTTATARSPEIAD